MLTESGSAHGAALSTLASRGWPQAVAGLSDWLVSHAGVHPELTHGLPRRADECAVEIKRSLASTSRRGRCGPAFRVDRTCQRRSSPLRRTDLARWSGMGAAWIHALGTDSRTCTAGSTPPGARTPLDDRRRRERISAGSSRSPRCPFWVVALGGTPDPRRSDCRLRILRASPDSRLMPYSAQRQRCGAAASAQAEAKRCLTLAACASSSPPRSPAAQTPLGPVRLPSARRRTAPVAASW